MGLDTLEGDPCAVQRGAGFKLSGNDYLEMGKTIGYNQIPTLFIQKEVTKWTRSLKQLPTCWRALYSSNLRLEGQGVSIVG
jgi:hypothetical protein